MSNCSNFLYILTLQLVILFSYLFFPDFNSRLYSQLKDQACEEKCAGMDVSNSWGNLWSSTQLASEWYFY